MKKKGLLAIGLALIVSMVGLYGCASESPVSAVLSSQQEGIWVTGQGEVTATPDIVTLRVGIEAQEASVAEAQARGTEAMNRVMDALKDQGVTEKDIQTQYFSIYRVTRWDREKEEEIVVGYRVSNMVTAKIRDVEKAVTVVDAVAQAGGDLTRINSVAFSIDDPSPYYEEAREKAIAEAEAKAKQLARLAGVSLGKPTYISEGIQTPPPVTRVMAESAPAPAAAPTPISPGEMEITLTVQVAYAIK